MASLAGALASITLRKRMDSLWRWRFMHWPMTLPSRMSRAANKVVRMGLYMQSFLRSVMMWVAHPVVRGWGHHYKRAHVRKLFHQLDGWLVRRIWSHRFGQWRCCGWTKLAPRKVSGEVA